MLEPYKVTHKEAMVALLRARVSMTQPEMARVLGISVSAVKKRLAALRRKVGGADSRKVAVRVRKLVELARAEDDRNV